MICVTMTSMPNRDPIDDNLSITDQALAWFAKLQKGGIGKVEKQQFELWCKLNPSHLKAYEQTEQFWRQLEVPAKAIHARMQAGESRPITKPSRWPYFTWVNCCLLLFAVISLQLPGFIQDWQSDYVTVAGERRIIALADSSRLTLNTNSAVIIEFSGTQRTVKLLRGEAYFEVAANKVRPFVVVADEVAARAVGTAFSVAALDSNKKEITVSEGVVTVTSGTQNQQLLANQHVRWRGGGLESAETVDIENYLAWRHGQVVFSRQPLAEVIQEVNRYRKWPIIIANRALAKRVISGVFKTDDPKAVISALTHTLHAKNINLPGGPAVIY